MAENKKSFVLYSDLIHVVRILDDEAAGKLFLTILEYVNDENPVIDDLTIQLAFEPIKQQLKRDLKKWEEFRKRQSENGKKGGRPPKGNAILEVYPLKPIENQTNPENPSLSLASQKSLNVNVNVNDNVNNILGEKTKKFFQVPTLAEVKNYCLERKNNVDPLKWFNFYTAKDWMIGKNKMKDWQAAVRTWEKTEKESSKPTVIVKRREYFNG